MNITAYTLAMYMCLCRR